MFAFWGVIRRLTLLNAVEQPGHWYAMETVASKLRLNETGHDLRYGCDQMDQMDQTGRTKQQTKLDASTVKSASKKGLHLDTIPRQPSDAILHSSLQQAPRQRQVAPLTQLLVGHGTPTGFQLPKCGPNVATNEQGEARQCYLVGQSE